MADNKCIICFEEKVNEVLLQCKHTFCEECVEHYIAVVPYNRRCPVCRADLLYYERQDIPLIVIVDSDESDSSLELDLISDNDF